MTMPKKSNHGMPVSVILMYCMIGIAVISAGIWLTNDLMKSRASIITERAALAVQTGNFMSQQFGTTITAADYVLRDVTTKVTAAELDLAGSDRGTQMRLSDLCREKMATLPGVYGFGILDSRCVFVAAADPRVVGIQSNSKLHVPQGKVLENSAYVEYVPVTKSANKQPAILVSRPILSSDGHFLGGALAAIMLSSAQSWVESFTIGKYDTVALVDADGILLAVNPSKPDAIGKLLQSLPGQPKFDDRRGSASFMAISPLDGRERIYGVSKVDNIPLSIIVGFDKDRTLREWQQRVWQMLAGFVILLLLLAVVLRMNLYALEQRNEMRMISITDPLTGVANRRQLTSSGAIEIGKAVRYKHHASLLMVDIDHFKSVNDTWGHPTGDRVIQSLANAMTVNLRTTDVVGRLGGEEFVAVLPGTNSAGAYVLANRLRESVERSADVKSDDGTHVSFTVSIGVAGLDDGASSSFEEILGRADKALYEAKARGRNTVVLG